ncbi:DNA repair protein RadA [Halorhodospira halophila]|uniref:DNA repair protein RadA n=1 Tax=Halorhodospira halophila (strain DSM 244 / SL1) TaxID=349124 RepID=A1WUS1_HALHL|nr:DNA repair protein RadA [Halorhodospira halophila]ABM61433.1 DNA replication and repair protein RadA [Halorhodospira halophila SL1]MBK1728680.1 DNA repair protein RadA [Halorhodospira halophila]
MARARRRFVCSACGAEQPQWAGQCPECGAWNTLEEIAQPAAAASTTTGRGAEVTTLAEVSTAPEPRLATGVAELDRVLGGGLVPGSVVLIGGEPGIGKSTLLLQTLATLSRDHAALYATGEESLQQVALRGHRLGVADDAMKLMAETAVEEVVAAAERIRPRALVLDSVQTFHTSALGSAPGSVSQVRESAAQLVRLAKTTGTAVILVGHVTKEGHLAGPRVLEHMVDTVLYFESDQGSRYRVVRAVKNRFGAANELGVFAMAEDGLRQVRNPSSIFLSRHDQDVPGSAVLVTREGSRPLLLEVQALVADSAGSQPRRVAVGLDGSRLALLLAVLQRHGGISTAGEDVFLNVVGGVRVQETAGDLPALAAVLSSLRNRPLPRDSVVFGELGLAGEVRPVPGGEERLAEAAKHGFTRAVVPAKNAPRHGVAGMEIHPVRRLEEAITALMG